ncbi:GPI ethanolamine phosphate transferase 1 [Holothuria leucospilota]|uniref:GPI ethanolamine phosphate transferase 1 n=1 Tax=Holothuria leucospilota TaxID=206669 RepID=A0A9Q1CBK2_HOLLE|nr:GPI ethanolamine phosphate transferase 1 [Holothuria leucospilota]
MLSYQQLPSSYCYSIEISSFRQCQVKSFGKKSCLEVPYDQKARHRQIWREECSNCARNIFRMDIQLAIIAFAIHIVFFASIFDIYFTSPLVHGMTPYKTNLEPPAKRLVLFVADGMRADKFFSLNDTGQSRAPFLRNIIETSGSWGVSHTRVPTESRPGHVALIAGFYEDVSAVAKGWKENPVEFDSVFNESRFTWSWGSPDILPMFAKGATGDHVFTHSYPAEVEDFAEADASKTDTWVFDRVEEFFNKSKDDQVLQQRLQLDQVVFFLHLLGIDTNGHSHKPFSMEYLENIKLVDAGVQKMVDIIENYYNFDEKTAYLLTADHGMTDWGSHGASHPDETLTPLVAWGSGINKPGPSNKKEFHDNFLEEWSLSHLQRMDVNQADIAPLMSSLIGTPYPLNSVGLLPVGYLDNSLPFKAESLFTNAKQILAQYEVKEQHMQQTTLTIFFRPYKKLSSSGRLKVLADIKQSIKDGAFEQAISKSQDVIKVALEGLNYYQTYDRLFLGISVTLSYLGWMAYLLFQVIHHHTNLLPHSESMSRKPHQINVTISFIIIGSLVTALLVIQSSPPMYYVYCLLPVLLWHAVCQNYKTFTTAFHQVSQNCGFSSILTNGILCLLGVETLVLSLFYREVISIGLVAIAMWPLLSSMRRNHLVSLSKVLAGVCLFIAGIFCLHQLPPSYTSGVYRVQLFIIVMATFLVHSTWSSIDQGNGLPVINQTLSWCILMASFFVPSAVSMAMIPRLLSIGLAFSSAYILLSTSHEGFFCLVLSVVMFFWLLCEQKSSKMTSTKLLEISFGDVTNLDRGPSRKLEQVDLRCAFFFVFFILTAFFGTGNIASINSFDPSAVYCFLTVFNPFVMGTLLLWKVSRLISNLLPPLTMYQGTQPNLPY